MCPGSTYSIVVADDQLMFREAVMRHLASIPEMNVVADVATAAGALEAVLEHKPDLLLTAIEMRGTGGIELIKTLNTMDLDTRVLVLTMHDTPTMKQAAMAAGAHGYITKSSSSDQLVTCIRCVATSHGSDIANVETLVTLASNAEAATSEIDSRLSSRERQVLALIGEGYTSKEIAEELLVSAGTVDNYRTRIGRKLGLKGRAAMVHYALQAGLVSSALKTNCRGRRP